MRAHIDIESQSEVDLTKVGVFIYAQHPSTRITCISVALGDGEVTTPVKYGERWPARYQLDSTISLGAHNAEFERTMLNGPPGAVLGFPRTSVNQWVCTAAKAASHALPRKLEHLLAALRLDERIDEGKHRNMLKTSKPYKGVMPTPQTMPKEFEKLYEDNRRDVEGERAVDKLLPDLIASERRLWILDQEINERGFWVNRRDIKRIIELRDEHVQSLVDECVKLCGFAPTQVEAVRGWLQSKGIELADMKAKTVLERKNEHRILEIRKETSKTSTAKFDRMLECSRVDGRVRGGHMFHGASPGRWTGKLVQSQNLPKPVIQGEVELAGQVGSFNLATLRLLYDSPMDAMSSLARPMIQAPEGKILRVGDFSQVEARIVPWLVGEEWKLEAFRRNEPIYESTAAKMFRVDLSFFTDYLKKNGHHHQWRDLGKRTELMCGYAGGVAAVKRSPGFEKINPQPKDEEIKGWVDLWRTACPRTVASWKNLANLCIKAIETRQVYSGYRCKFGMVTYGKVEFLRIQLPSKRSIYMAEPQVHSKQMWWDEGKNRYVEYEIPGVESRTMKEISHMQDHSKYGWVRERSHGGIILQNITEGVGRDLLAHGMINLDNAGYPITMHVHDEAVAETDEDFGSTEEFLELLTDKPGWAEDFPLAAAGYSSQYYHKD